MTSASLPNRRVVKLHRDVLRWTVMVTVERPVENAYGGLPYAHGSGRHPEWRLSWWRRG